MSSSEATENSTEAAAGAVPAAKVPVMPLMVAMLVAVVLGAGAVGGGLFYALKSGKLTLPGQVVVTQVEAKEKEPVKSHPLIMEPILVNLQDAGGRAYLRVGLTLQVLDDEPVKGAKEKEEKPEKGPKLPSAAETSARDVVLTVLGQQTSDELLEADGKEALKSKLRTGLKEHDPELKVSELFFTEFLVQR